MYTYGAVGNDYNTYIPDSFATVINGSYSDFAFTPSDL